MIAPVAEPPAPTGRGPATIDIAWLRGLSVRLLARMYVPAERLFVFRLRRDGESVMPEGRSRRYTAIVLIGLATEDDTQAQAICGNDDLDAICSRLIADLPAMNNLGDAALTLWAAQAVGHSQCDEALQRVISFRPTEESHPTVELAWTVTALSLIDAESALRDAVARRLLDAFNPRSCVFPHVVGSASALRSHVCCFADLVYPVQALAHYHRCTANEQAIDAARRCAQQFCKLQGSAGQWWWHYDVRTGDVIEGYPVYSVHQDAMAPMALFALQHACGADHLPEVRRGLDWMVRCPELGGDSIIDPQRDILWRKVARREPRKLARRLQAVASRLHPSMRMPGVDLVFRPGAMDYECRPYHLGWLLHAFPASRAGLWGAASGDGAA